MKVYVAGSWNDKDSCKRIRQFLISHGYTVTSRWLDVEHGPVMPAPDQALIEASNDLEDIDQSDVIVVSNLLPSASGGFHVETGYALAKGKGIVLLGTPSTPFHHLPQVMNVAENEHINALLSCLESFTKETTCRSSS